MAQADAPPAHAGYCCGFVLTPMVVRKEPDLWEMNFSPVSKVYHGLGLSKVVDWSPLSDSACNRLYHMGLR